MATASLLLSGGVRVSYSVTSGNNVVTQAFSSLLTAVSVFTTQTVVTLPGVSTYSVSLASSPQAVIMTATGTVRIGFTGTSALSGASAFPTQFREMFAMVAGSTALPSAFYLANSGSDSATVTILMGT
jgi:hypothetical protein